jgi:hypothetical protein
VARSHVQRSCRWVARTGAPRRDPERQQARACWAGPAGQPHQYPCPHQRVVTLRAGPALPRLKCRSFPPQHSPVARLARTSGRSSAVPRVTAKLAGEAAAMAALPTAAAPLMQQMAGDGDGSRQTRRSASCGMRATRVNHRERDDRPDVGVCRSVGPAAAADAPGGDLRGGCADRLPDSGGRRPARRAEGAVGPVGSGDRGPCPGAGAGGRCRRCSLPARRCACAHAVTVPIPGPLPVATKRVFPRGREQHVTGSHQPGRQVTARA